MYNIINSKKLTNNHITLGSHGKQHFAVFISTPNLMLAQLLAPQAARKTGSLEQYLQHNPYGEEK